MLSEFRKWCPGFPKCSYVHRIHLKLLNVGASSFTSASERSNSAAKPIMLNIRITFVNPSDIPTEYGSKFLEPSPYGNFVTIASWALLYPFWANSRKNRLHWLLFGKSDREARQQCLIRTPTSHNAIITLTSWVTIKYGPLFLSNVFQLVSFGKAAPKNSEPRYSHSWTWPRSQMHPAAARSLWPRSLGHLSGQDVEEWYQE